MKDLEEVQFRQISDGLTVDFLKWTRATSKLIIFVKVQPSDISLKVYVFLNSRRQPPQMECK